jgi:predicted GIY-YIG superfamily endonuclease
MINLYRHFDEAGSLLYVGISLSAVNRLSRHSHGSRWFSEIARVEIEKFGTREAAHEAETEAIRRERPKYNVHHVKKPEPVKQNIENTEQTKLRQRDRLINFRDVNALIGSKCKTGHMALALARRGIIQAVRINERLIRYKESSVIELVSGRVELMNKKSR